MGLFLRSVSPGWSLATFGDPSRIERFVLMVSYRFRPFSIRMPIHQTVVYIYICVCVCVCMSCDTCRVVWKRSYQRRHVRCFVFVVTSFVRRSPRTSRSSRHNYPNESIETCCCFGSVNSLHHRIPTANIPWREPQGGLHARTS
jgi:hypothetical protein